MWLYYGNANSKSTTESSTHSRSTVNRVIRRKHRCRDKQITRLSFVRGYRLNDGHVDINRPRTSHERIVHASCDFRLLPRLQDISSRNLKEFWRTAERRGILRTAPRRMIVRCVPRVEGKTGPRSAFYTMDVFFFFSAGILLILL